MPPDRPHIIVLGGPNGSGKTTTAPRLLQGTLAVTEFVNADTIAAGLSAFDPQRAAMEAGRILLARLHELARQRKDFAFEITLAGRSFVPWLRRLIQSGYSLHLFYLWLPSADLAVARVAERVRMGGHDVPEETVRRRYNAGVRNFFHLYRPLASTWRVYDNSVDPEPLLVAAGRAEVVERVFAPEWWTRITDEANR